MNIILSNQCDKTMQKVLASALDCKMCNSVQECCMIPVHQVIKKRALSLVKLQNSGERGQKSG